MFLNFKLFIFFILIPNQNYCEKVNFSCNDLHILFDESKHFVNLQRVYENMLRKNNVTLSANEIGHNFFKSSPLEFSVSEEFLKADIFTQTASLFYDKIKYNDYDMDVPSLFQNLSNCFLESSAANKRPNITVLKYRTIDGSKNNIKNPLMGSSFSSFGRLLKASYNDNIHSVRRSVRGYNLPSPRNIVRKLFLNDIENLNKFQDRKVNIPNNAALMFGQYIANDLSSKQNVQYIDGAEDGIRCCANYNKYQLPSTLMHSACLPITISKNDPFYSNQGIKCMGFVRSHVISNNPYRVEIGEQVNTVTSFLDHSNIYGSSPKVMKKVRSFNGGRLKTNLKNILPVENGNYFSGDDRVVHTPLIALWHSLFVRNHNNLADKLAVMNRHWDGNQIFNEARKINIAIYQKIVYEEWLPIFLGVHIANGFKNVSYDSNLDASTVNEFSAAAFRFMHSFIDSEITLLKNDNEVVKLNLSDTITNSKILEDSFDEVLRGMMNQKINLMGYSEEILNKLFKNKNDIGMDLLSIDILRGRDHGIPPYIKYRKYCNMGSKNINVFDDLFPQISKSAIIQLRQTYKSVFDIDLLVGAALENLNGNNETDHDSGFFGPTFECIIKEQFYRLKAGDSYFYKHEGNFNEEQMKALESYNVANFICENTDLELVNENFFITYNSRIVNCSEIQPLNLSYWEEY